MFFNSYESRGAQAPNIIGIYILRMYLKEYIYIFFIVFCFLLGNYADSFHLYAKENITKTYTKL